MTYARINIRPTGLMACLLCLSMMAACTESESTNTDNTSDTRTELTQTNSTESTESDLVSGWRQRLSGARLYYFHTYSGGFANAQKLDLCPQGNYAFYTESSIDMLGPVSEAGTWALQQQGESVYLILTTESGQTSSSQLRNGEKGRVLVGNRPYLDMKEEKYAPNCN